MFAKSTRFKQVCQLLLSLIVGSNWKQKNTKEYDLLGLTIKSRLNKEQFLNDIN